MQREGEGAVVRQGRLIAVVWVLLIGCAVLLVVGCSGTRSEAPQEKEKGHTEATKKEQTRSAKAASEEARCEGTRKTNRNMPFSKQGVVFTTNDLPGCPKGGPLSGTDKRDNLAGLDGDDEIRGLGTADVLYGGSGSDVIYAGPGDAAVPRGDRVEGYGDEVIWYRSMNVLYGGPGRDSLNGDAGDDGLFGGDGDDDIWGGSKGADTLYGGAGNDLLNSPVEHGDRRPNKLFCGKGRDTYLAAKMDYVHSSCEKKATVGPGGGGA